MNLATNVDREIATYRWRWSQWWRQSIWWWWWRIGRLLPAAGPPPSPPVLTSKFGWREGRLPRGRFRAASTPLKKSKVRVYGHRVDKARKEEFKPETRKFLPRNKLLQHVEYNNNTNNNNNLSDVKQPVELLPTFRTFGDQNALKPCPIRWELSISASTDRA